MPDDILAAIPSTDYEHRTLGYLKEAIQEGEGFLRAQKGFRQINDAIDSIIKDNRGNRPSSLSNTTLNLASKVATDLVAMCTDTKPFWEYRTRNSHFKKAVEIAGHLSEHWYLNRFADIKNADVIRYSIVGGTGYGHLYFNSLTNDIDLSAEDPRDVIPIRPPSTSLSLQEAFGVIHRSCRTVNFVKAKFPTKSDRIVADRDGSSSLPGGVSLDILSMPPIDPLTGVRPIKELPRLPVVDLYTCYITDDSINKTNKSVYMGGYDEDGNPSESNWSYEVEPGEPLYPRKRCIIFTNTAILYDGPNPYWHGLFPYCKLTLDPWPWSWLGKGIMWDILPLQKALDNLMQIMDDYMAKVARPDLIADRNAISKSDWEKIDTRRAGLKLRFNPIGGKGVQVQAPAGLPPDFLQVVNYYEQKMYEIPGIRDLSSLMKLNQMPSSDSIERIIEAMAPSVRLRSRILEAYMREFATMLAWNFAQFYNLPMRLAILGEQGATEADFDFDPDTFLPAWQAEDYNEEGIITPEALKNGPMPRYNRAKEFFKQVSYHIAPSSLLNASEIETQMKYLQLARGGLVDHWTLLEVLNIPNVGNPPPGATTITQRLMAEQQMGLGMMVSSAGRKSSGQEPPQTRSSGAISESG